MNALDREFEKRLFREAYNIAAAFSLDLPRTIELARRLTSEAMAGAKESPDGEQAQPEPTHKP